MIVAIYARYSPRPLKELDQSQQARCDNEDAETIRLQVDVCQKYAQMKNLTVTHTIKDPETSARKTPLFDREAGQQLQNLPKGSHVICSKLDRMFRSTVDGLTTIQFFKDNGINLHFADQSGCSLDASTGEGEFLLTVLLGIASLEPRRTADRTSRGMKHRQQLGQRMTSAATLPFGKQLDPIDGDRVVTCESELDASETAFALRNTGLSLNSISHAIGPIRGKLLGPQSVKRLIAITDIPDQPIRT